MLSKQYRNYLYLVNLLIVNDRIQICGNFLIFLEYFL